MRYYTKQHRYYCGIDLHARSLYVCILDGAGEVLVHRKVAAAPEAFLEVIAPYREDVAVAVECMFTWYWLADLCAREGIAFVLGHALYMKAIHGAKAKNDRVDAYKIAMLLRAGMIPVAYVYPRAMRATRDLLRRRTHLMRKRGQLLAHIQNTSSQYNLPELGKKIAYKVNREGVPEHFEPTDTSVQKSVELDLELIGHFDRLIRGVELHIVRHAREHDPQAYARLRTVPGIGKVLALVILYEIHDIGRFETVGQFASYSRLVRCARESDGKRKGTSGKKIGNAHLKWAFSEAAALFLRNNPRGRQYHEKLKRRFGKGKALTILAHKLGRAVYYMLARNQAFDLNRFLATAG